MPAVASLEELKTVDEQLKAIKGQHPEPKIPLKSYNYVC